MKRLTSALIAVFMAVLGNGPIVTVAAATAGSSLLAQDTQLVGVWQFETGDLSTYQKITLTLRGDGTYTKTLKSRVNGSEYGGTHSGTWSSQGTVVRLSGDGNWPPYTHDLSRFTRVG